MTSVLIRWVGLHLNHDYYTHKLERTGEHDLYKDGKPYDRKGVGSDTIFADEAISFIKGDSEKPFFIYLPFQAPHSPFQDPDVPFDPPGKKKRQNVDQDDRASRSGDRPRSPDAR